MQYTKTNPFKTSDGSMSSQSVPPTMLTTARMRLKLVRITKNHQACGFTAQSMRMSQNQIRAMMAHKTAPRPALPKKSTTGLNNANPRNCKLKKIERNAAAPARMVKTVTPMGRSLDTKNPPVMHTKQSGYFFVIQTGRTAVDAILPEADIFFFD